MSTEEEPSQRIAVVGDHTCAMLTSGQALCWGEGANGRLASGG